jgi:triphosphoribosyl-dephospho-CoA synthetase
VSHQGDPFAVLNFDFPRNRLLRRRELDALNVWSAIERIAAKLMEGGKLSVAEALAVIGGDVPRPHP